MFGNISRAIMKTFFPALICLALVSVAAAEDNRYTVPLGDSPSLGPENAPVTIVEFIDFQ